MISNPQPHNDHTAWQRAWRSRCCPPDWKLVSERNSPELDAHLSLCPWCHLSAGENPCDPSFLTLMAERFREYSPKAGEIWGVSPELSGWGEKCRYYAAPIVLVIDATDDHLVTVMQIYDDLFFAGPGDISMQPAVDGFVETWNRYSLCRDDLMSLLGLVSNETLKLCQEATSVPTETIEAGSLLWFFRNMEVETGFFIARKAISKAMSSNYSKQNDDESYRDINLPRHRLLDAPLSDIRKNLIRLGLKCPIREKTDEDLINILSQTDIADERLPLAAADGDENVRVITFTSRDGVILEYGVTHLAVNHIDHKGATLLVSGILEDKAPVFDEVFCRLRTAEGLLAPDPGAFGLKDGVFWAAFSVGNLEKFPDKTDLIIRCIRYE